MENYIKKINSKVINENDTDKQKRIKKVYLISGGLTLALGLAGFVASFITFMVLFVLSTTDAAFIAWIVAIPFILMIIAGSIVTRIGDMLLKEEAKHINQEENAKKELEGAESKDKNIEEANV